MNEKLREKLRESLTSVLPVTAIVLLLSVTLVPLEPGTLLLFLMGVVFCYRAVYMLALDFFLVSGENLATPMLSIDKYVGFLFSFVLPFGLVFELPVAIYMLTRVGLVNYEMLSKTRKFVILAIFVIAAILTPPDVVSQVMLGIPMLLLFEVGVQVSRFVKPRERS